MAAPDARCDEVKLATPVTTCCDEDGLTAALRKAGSDDLAQSSVPVFTGLTFERIASEERFFWPPVPPAPPPEDGLYTLHSAFLI